MNYIKLNLHLPSLDVANAHTASSSSQTSHSYSSIVGVGAWSDSVSLVPAPGLVVRAEPLTLSVAAAQGAACACSEELVTVQREPLCVYPAHRTRW